MVPVAFELATAARILFGAGRARELPAIAAELGMHHVLLVTGRDPARSGGLEAALRAVGMSVQRFAVEGEPSVELARAGMNVAMAAGCDGVIAFGGGSALDAGKALAALVANGGDPLDYLEVIGRGRALSRSSLPFVAVPTTAGTGSEVTRNAVLASAAAQVKASLRSPHMLPNVALVDPDLLIGLPRAVLAASGMDALSQLIEPFLSSRANPVTEALAREGIRRSARSLRRAVIEGADDSAREDLALASVFGGLCLANAGLGAVHGFAAPIGGTFAAPHGAVCAALLPAVLDVNHRAMASRTPDHAALLRMHELGALLTGDPEAGVDAALAWVEALRVDLGIAGLESYGMREADVAAIVAKAKTASSMKGNPILLTDEELTEIALRAL